MINKYEKKILNKLIDKYENSKSFSGDNKVVQKFSIKVETLFRKYKDHSNYEEFKNVNEAIDILLRSGFVFSDRNSSKVFSKVYLNTEVLSDIYVYLGRVSKREVNEALMEIIEKYRDKNEILKRFCKDQEERILSNKSIRFFLGDIEEFEDILESITQIMYLKEEIFIRDFSVKIFRDSKRFERISNKVTSIIYEYGNYPDKEQVLGNLNIIKNPTYVNFKGNGIIKIKGQSIDLSVLKGDIAISSKILEDVDEIKILGNKIITIENLTSFNSFNECEFFSIYLGGFHNSIRREFIKKIYDQNAQVEFYHFGDIDAGGFYILEHLKKQTGIRFKPYKMDRNIIETYKEYTKSITENDRGRLEKLLDTEYREVIQYMLDNNIKLEQEAINSNNSEYKALFCEEL